MDVSNFPSVPTGTELEFKHIRKGTFKAKFLDFDFTDEHDPFIRVSIPTGPESGQERLANSYIRVGTKKQTPEFSEKLLRSSLIEEVKVL